VSFKRFIEILRRANRETYVEDLLDALWLAQQKRDLMLYSSARASLPATRRPNRPPSSRSGETESEAEQTPPEVTPSTEPPAPDVEGTASVYPSGAAREPGPTKKASPVAVPAGKALTNRLQLARALRPFRERWPSHHGVEIDEQRTVEATANLNGLFFPVFRPLQEPWFTVDLVLEDDPVIDVWQDALLGFSQMLRETGAFMDVRTWRLRVGRTGSVSSSSSDILEAFAGGHVSTRFVAGSGTRRLIFFATHGSSSRWFDGTYLRILESWFPTCSVVLLHMLSKELWRRTPLGEPVGTCRSQDPGLPSARLTVNQFWWKSSMELSERRLFLPVVAMNHPELSEWAQMQMARGRKSPVFVCYDQPLDSPRTPVQVASQPSAQRVVSLLGSESPEAFRLAVYLSSKPFTLPVARLIQEAKFGPAAQSSHLADVLLSGLIFAHATDDLQADPNTTYYEFYPEAKRLLHRSLRLEDAEAISRSLEHHLSLYIEGIKGRPFSFRALIPDANGQYTLPEWAQPFAHLGVALLGAPQKDQNPRELFNAFRAQASDEVFNSVRDSVLSEPDRVLSSVVTKEALDALISARLVRQNSSRQWEGIPGIEALFAEVLEPREVSPIVQKPVELQDTFTSQGSVGGNDFALIVGINWYAELPQLAFASDGASRFAHWLGRPGHAIPANQIRTLISNDSDTPVTSSAIAEAFFQFAKIVTQKLDARRFYFYFSGHYCLSSDRQPLLLTSEVSTIKRRSIAILEYVRWLTVNSEFDEIVCIVDGPTASFLSAPWETLPVPESRRSGPPPSLLVLRDEFAFGPRSQTSSLTTLLVDGLQGAAATPSGEITGSSLRSFLDARMGRAKVFFEQSGPEMVLVSDSERRGWATEAPISAEVGLPESVIVTSLPVEQQAAQAHLRDSKWVHTSGLQFHVGSLSHAGNELRVAILPVLHASQNLASTIDQAFHLGARTFISVGTASGFGGARLGDVIVSDRVFERIGNGSTPDRLASIVEPDAALLESAKVAAGETRWLTMVLTSGGDRNPHAYVGPIISDTNGAEVPMRDLKPSALDPTAFEFLDIVSRKAGAKGLVVRGISALPGQERGARAETEVAARHAAAFCFAVLEQMSEQVVESDSKSPADVHVKRAKAFISSRKYDEAFSQYEMAIQLDPDRPEIYNGFGHILRSQRWYEKAVENFRKAIALNPAYSEAYRNLGLALSGQKKYDEAISMYQKAIQLNPTDAVAYKNLGTALSAERRFDEAVSEYRKAIRLKPRYASAFKNNGDAFFRQGKYSEAIDQYQRAVTLNPNYASAHSNWGDALRSLKKYEAAIEHYRQAIQINPRAIHARIDMAQALYHIGKLQDAVQSLNGALEIAPRNAKAYVWLGHSLIQLNRIEEGIKSYRKAVQINPRDVESYNDIGLVLANAGKIDEAIEYLQTAIKLEPNLPRSRDNLRQVLRNAGRLDEAGMFYKRDDDYSQSLRERLKAAGFRYLAFVSYALPSNERERDPINAIINALDAELQRKYLLNAPLFSNSSHHEAEPLPRVLREALDKSVCLVIIVTSGYLQSPSADGELRTFNKLLNARFPGHNAILPITLLGPSRLPDPLARIRSLDLSELVTNPQYRQTDRFRLLISEATQTLVSMAEAILKQSGNRIVSEGVERPTPSQPQTSSKFAPKENALTYRSANALEKYPLRKKHADDIQKSRWGGRHTADGRRLTADVTKHGPEDYGLALRVSSTDGSELHGPVRFHLHDTFPRSPITIRKCDPDAVLEELSVWGAFTVGAEVPRLDGKRTVLELDLESSFRRADDAYRLLQRETGMRAKKKTKKTTKKKK